MRRRRAKFRAWHRGMREMDLIMGRFADAHIETLEADDMDRFEALLDEQDQAVFSWLSGSVPVPADYDTPLFARIRAFHTHHQPIEF